MSQLRFNHVFFSLMAIAFISAFILAGRVRVGDRSRAQVQNIFAPVAWPVSRLAGWVQNRVAGDVVRDNGSPSRPRDAVELIRENTQLRIQIASMKGQIARLEELEANRNVGDVRALCTPFSVIGGDSSGLRESLMISGTSLDGIREPMPVLYTEGIAGRISRSGVGGAHVLLVTDPQSRLTASFARFVKQSNSTLELVRLATDAFLVEGAGRGEMVMKIPEKRVKEIDVRLDDWLVLHDRQGWPRELEGYRIGFVRQIAPSRSPGFVEIRIAPGKPLLQLQEVMVMNK